MIAMPTQDSSTLKSFPWSYSYKTSGTGPDGRPTDILQDFYIPALKRSVRYDRVAGYFRSSWAWGSDRAKLLKIYKQARKIGLILALAEQFGG